MGTLQGWDSDGISRGLSKGLLTKLMIDKYQLSEGLQGVVSYLFFRGKGQHRAFRQEEGSKEH